MAAHKKERMLAVVFVAVVARQRLKANEVFINTENTPYLHDSESKLPAHARIVIAIDVCNMICKKQVHFMAKCCPAHELTVNAHDEEHTVATQRASAHHRDAHLTAVGQCSSRAHLSHEIEQHTSHNRGALVRTFCEDNT